MMARPPDRSTEIAAELRAIARRLSEVAEYVIAQADKRTAGELERPDQ